MTELTQEPQKIESAPASSASGAALAFIFATVLFDTLGFGIIIPVLLAWSSVSSAAILHRAQRSLVCSDPCGRWCSSCSPHCWEHYPTAMVDDPSSSFQPSAAASTT